MKHSSNFTQLTIVMSALFAQAAMAQASNDTLAIQELLERESATWRLGNSKAHAQCWQLRPYSKIWVSTLDGKFIDVPVGDVVYASKDRMGKGGTSENSNYQFSIHGDQAWVSHDERSTDKTGTVSYSHEVRILEKVNGAWKLVAQFIHAYLPPQ